MSEKSDLWLVFERVITPLFESGRIFAWDVWDGCVEVTHGQVTLRIPREGGQVEVRAEDLRGQRPEYETTRHDDLLGAIDAFFKACGPVRSSYDPGKRKTARERKGWSEKSEAEKARNLAHNCPWL